MLTMDSATPDTAEGAYCSIWIYLLLSHLELRPVYKQTLELRIYRSNNIYILTN